jgi:hypothetical protein
MTTITTGASGPQAWKIALVAGAVGLATLVAVNLPQTTSDTTGEQVAATATATLPESVTGFEYNNESTSGRVASPGVTSQYTGNSDELFPYENGPAPQTVAGQGTARVASTPDSIADAQVRAEAAQVVPAPSFAASDEALVNPVPEVDAAQLIEDLIAAELVPPAPSFAASDEARRYDLVPEVNAAQLIQDQIAAGIAARAPADPVSSIPANANAEAGTNARWGALHEAYHNGTLSSYTARSAEPNPADIKYLEGSPQPAETQRVPQSNVSIR